MAFNKLAWWRSLLTRRWRTADATAAALPEPQQAPPRQQQQSGSGRGPVVSARLRLLELTGNDIRSPFHRCNYLLLLLLTYVGLLVGGAIGLPWLLLCCWPTWGLRMLSFCWGGLSTVFDLFWLPAAVRAFQQRSRQVCVKKALRDRLRKELRGLDVAAFLGELYEQQQQLVRQEGAASGRDDSSCDSSRSGCSEEKGNSEAATADTEQRQQRAARPVGPEQPGGAEQARQTRTASVKEELQHANILRQQRAAAAAAAAAATNAQRLGLSTLADCRRRAGKAALTEKDLNELLRDTHVESELLSVFAAASTTEGERRQQQTGGAITSRCFVVEDRRAAAVSSLPFTAATAFPCAAAAASALLVGGDAAASTTSAAAEAALFRRSGAAAAWEHTTVGAAAARSSSTSSASSPASASSSAAEGRRDGAGVCVAAGTARCDSYADSGGSGADEELQVRGDLGCSRPCTGLNGRSGSSSAATGRKQEGEAEDDEERTFSAGERKGKAKRARSWKSVLPWQLIFRGLVAHFQCSYLVDLLFCHAELSPLSSSVQRELLLLLHCLVRGLTVFVAFASPSCYTPYAHELRTRHLLKGLCVCFSGSFGATACLLAAPLFIEVVLQPLLRLLGLPVVQADVVLSVVGGARLVLPSLSLGYKGNTWERRADFYATSQLVTLAVVTAGAYAAVRLYDEEPQAAAAARTVYARDLLALLALKKLQETARDGATGGAAAGRPAETQGGVAAVELKNGRVDARRPENGATSAGKKGGAAEAKVPTAPTGRGRATVGGHSPEAGTGRREEGTPICEKKVESGVSGARRAGRQQQQLEKEVPQSAGQHGEELTPAGRVGKTHRESEEEEQQQEKFDERLSLLLAEKVVEERAFVEASDFELLRRRLVSRLLFTAGAVAACCVLLCWTAVAFLAVSNVVMRVNTPSDVLQERENVRLMSTAAAAAASLLDEEAGGDFEDWAEELRLLREELRDILNDYRRVQRQQGWFAATVELWEKLGEEFKAAWEERSAQWQQEMNAYAVLGVKRSATGADIKKAYKLLAKQLHPDLLAAAASRKPAAAEELDAATERMRQINAAYEKLMRRHGGRGGKSS